MNTLYETYMLDYLNNYMETASVENHYYEKNLQPLIAEKLKDKSNIDLIIRYIGEFISRNNKGLSAAGPSEMIPFPESEINKYYKIFDITKDQLLKQFEEMVKETYMGQNPYNDMVIKSSPHKILFTGILVYALLNKNDDLIECCKYLMVFSDYPMVFDRYWMYGVKRDVMDYTIEHLANKFIIRKLKNVLDLLYYIGNSAVSLFKDRLVTQHDNYYVDFVLSVRTKLNSNFHKISNEYYANYEKNATQHSQVDSFEDGTLNDTEGNLTKISSLSDHTYEKFLSNGIHSSTVGIVAKSIGIDSVKLTNYLNTIKNDKNNKVDKLIESIIYLYFNHKKYDGSGIPSGQFLNFGLGLYKSISLSKDKHSINIKEILDYWQEKTGLSEDTNRDATISYYRKAMFTYFIIIINDYN